VNGSLLSKNMNNYHQPDAELSDEDFEEIRENHKRKSKHDRLEVKRYLQRCLRENDFECDDLDLL
jgi:hypothetical protein